MFCASCDFWLKLPVITVQYMHIATQRRHPYPLLSIRIYRIYPRIKDIVCRCYVLGWPVNGNSSQDYCALVNSFIINAIRKTFVYNKRPLVVVAQGTHHAIVEHISLICYPLDVCCVWDARKQPSKFNLFSLLLIWYFLWSPVKRNMVVRSRSSRYTCGI